MKQKIIRTSKVEMLVIDLPNGTTYKTWTKKQTKIQNGKDKVMFEGNWQNLGKATELTEEDWKGVVDETYLMSGDYKNYGVNSGWGVKTATESGISLLKAIGVLLENELGDKPVNNSPKESDTYYSDLYDYNCSLAVWNDAESKVWRNAHVFIKQK